MNYGAMRSIIVLQEQEYIKPTDDAQKHSSLLHLWRDSNVGVIIYHQTYNGVLLMEYFFK